MIRVTMQLHEIVLQLGYDSLRVFGCGIEGKANKFDIR